MLDGIRNIYCVGRNYKLHAAELGNSVPESPMLFTKPTHSLVPLTGQTLTLPGDRGRIHYETELVLSIGNTYEKGVSVDELADGFAVGLDFTLRDVQEEIKKKGQPWLPAKGFLGSSPVGPFRTFESAAALERTEFSMLLNGAEAQRGNIRDMIFSLQQIVDFCGVHYGLGKGDLIYTGTPHGVGEVGDGDRLQLFWGEEPAGACMIRLAAE
jgi:fumarylpyruvate hydrolase